MRVVFSFNNYAIKACGALLDGWIRASPRFHVRTYSVQIQYRNRRETGGCRCCETFSSALAHPLIAFSDFWDTAGQERFDSLHPSYYYAAHACILVSFPIQAAFLCRRALLTWSVMQVFDITRKVTYTNLSKWYAELQENRPSIPCIVVANKIDRTLLTASFVLHHETICFPVDLKATKKSFNFASKRQACRCCSHQLHAVTLICSSHLHS